MTAPVVEAAPVVETQAPTDTVPPITESAEPQTMSAVLDTINNRVVPQDEPVAEPAAVEGEAPAVEGAPVEEDDNSPLVTLIQFDEPDGQVDLRSRDPETGQFREMDASQAFEFSMKDKATGETRSYNKTLPELVRLAKDGIAMQQSRDELQAYRQGLPQMQTLLQQKEEEAKGLRALAEQLLTGTPDYVNQQRAAYAQEMTPEKIYARQLAELQQERARIAAQQTNTQQAYENRQTDALTGAIGPVIQEVEGLVGPEMATGKMMRDTVHLMVNGRYPPQNFPALQAYVHGPYLQWAKEAAAKKAQTATETVKAKETQKAAQAAVRAAGAATRPSTVASGAASATPVSKAPVGLEATIQSIISKPIPQVA